MQTRPRLVVFALAGGLALLTSCGSENITSSPTSTAASATTIAAGHQLITAAAAATLLNTPPAGLVVLDVRTPEEFATGHIASAIDIDLQGTTWAADVAKLDPNAPYFVYCHSGNRSAQAASYLRQQGFTSILELEGGIGAWQTAGLPIVTT